MMQKSFFVASLDILWYEALAGLSPATSLSWWQGVTGKTAAQREVA